jgi:DNA-binding transcriptional regulator YiaG
MKRRALTQRDLDDIRAARTAGARPPAVGRGRALREAAQLTQSEVALAVSAPTHPVSREAVGAWESGDRIPSGPRALEYGRFLRRRAERHPAVDAAFDQVADGAREEVPENIPAAV